MKNNENIEYKTIHGLTRGLMLLNVLNWLDGGTSVGLLVELSGLHRTMVRRLLEILQSEGYVRRSLFDNSSRLTIKARQLSEGFHDEQWTSVLAAPLPGDLLREVIWLTDVSTLDMDAIMVCEVTYHFSRLSLHRTMVGHHLPLLETVSGLAWLTFYPGSERQELIRMPVSRPGEEFQFARESLKLNAILSHVRKNSFGQNFHGRNREEGIASIATLIRSE